MVPTLPPSYRPRAPHLPLTPVHPLPISPRDTTPTYEYPPIPLNPLQPPFTLRSHPFRRIPARPKIPPPSVGSATNYCIGNRLDYQSFDNASSSAASAPLAVSERARSLTRVGARALSTHPPSYPLVTIPLYSVPWQIICSDEA